MKKFLISILLTAIAFTQSTPKGFDGNAFLVPGVAIANVKLHADTYSSGENEATVNMLLVGQIN